MSLTALSCALMELIQPPSLLSHTLTEQLLRSFSKLIQQYDGEK